MALTYKAAAIIAMGIGAAALPHAAKAQGFAPIDPNVSAQLTAPDFEQKIEKCIKSAMANTLAGRDSGATQGNIICSYANINDKFTFKVMVMSDNGAKAYRQATVGLDNADGRVTLEKRFDTNDVAASMAIVDNGKLTYQTLDTGSRNVAPAVAAMNSMIGNFKNGGL